MSRLICVFNMRISILYELYSFLMSSKRARNKRKSITFGVNVLPIVCGSSVFVFVLLCIYTLCPFLFRNHLEEEEKAGCFAIIVL